MLVNENTRLIDAWAKLYASASPLEALTIMQTLVGR